MIRIVHTFESILHKMTKLRRKNYCTVVLSCCCAWVCIQLPIPTKMHMYGLRIDIRYNENTLRTNYRRCCANILHKIKRPINSMNNKLFCHYLCFIILRLVKVTSTIHSVSSVALFNQQKHQQLNKRFIWKFVVNYQVYKLLSQIFFFRFTTTKQKYYTGIVRCDKRHTIRCLWEKRKEV